jgi:hypothetical protein
MGADIPLASPSFATPWWCGRGRGLGEKRVWMTVLVSGFDPGSAGGGGIVIGRQREVDLIAPGALPPSTTDPPAAMYLFRLSQEASTSLGSLTHFGTWWRPSPFAAMQPPPVSLRRLHRRRQKAGSGGGPFRRLSWPAAPPPIAHRRRRPWRRRRGSLSSKGPDLR